jgi:hypothetical protein
VSRRLIWITGLVVLDVAIVTVCFALPPREWLNYLMTVSLALTGFLLWLWLDHAALRRLGPTFGLRALPPTGKLALGVVLGTGSMALIVVIIWLLGGFSPGAGFQEYAIGCRETLAASARGDGDMMYINDIGKALMIHGFGALAEEIVFCAMGMGLCMMLLFWLARVVAGGPGRRSSSDAPNGAAVRWNRRAWLWAGLIANLGFSICFGLIHAGSPGATTISLLNITLSGLIYGQLFVLQGSVLSAWTMHWFWNVSQSALGLPVSGTLVADGPLLGWGFTGARESALSGGMYGPEGSLVAVIVQLAILVWLGWLSWRSGADGSAIEQRGMLKQLA